MKIPLTSEFFCPWFLLREGEDSLGIKSQNIVNKPRGNGEVGLRTWPLPTPPSEWGLGGELGSWRASLRSPRSRLAGPLHRPVLLWSGLPWGWRGEDSAPRACNEHIVSFVLGAMRSIEELERVNPPTTIQGPSHFCCWERGC